MLLENESFLFELTKMFEKGKNSGSVVITMKRWDGRSKPIPRDLDKKPLKNKKLKKKLEKLRADAAKEGPCEFKCLLRANLGNKKISTVVTTAEAIKFQASYSTLLRGNIDGLKKKKEKKATTVQ